MNKYRGLAYLNHNLHPVSLIKCFHSADVFLHHGHTDFQCNLCTLTKFVFENVCYTTVEDWKKDMTFKKNYVKSRAKIDLCAESNHLSPAKATFPCNIWFNEYICGDYLAFTMIPFPIFWTFCHEVSQLLIVAIVVTIVRWCFSL